MARAGPRRLHWLTRALMGLVFALVFTLFVLVGAVLHLNVPPLRGLVTAALNTALAEALTGEVRVSAVERIGASSVVLERASVKENAQGPLLLELEGVRLHVEPQLLLLDWLFGEPGSALTLAHLRVERAVVKVVFDGSSPEPSLVRALTPRKAATPSTHKKARRSLTLPVIELGRVEFEVQHPSVPALRGAVERIKATLNVTQEHTTLSVERFALRLSEPERFATLGTGSLAASFPGPLWGKFHGFVHGIELDAVGSLEAALLKLDLKVARAEAADVRALLPEWPLVAALGADVNVQGRLPTLELKALLRARRTLVDGAGMLVLERAPSAQLALSVSDLDLALFGAGLPPTELDAAGRVTLATTSAGTTLDFEATTEPAVLAQSPLPSTALSGRFDPQGLSGNLSFTEDDANVSAHVVVPRAGPLQVEASVRDFALGSWSRYPGLPAARLTLQARATLDAGVVRGNVRGQVQDGRAGPVSLKSAELDASVRGPLARWRELEIKADVAARQVALGPLEFAAATLNASARGGQARFALGLGNDAGPRGSFNGLVELAAEPTFSNVALTLDHADMHLTARVPRANPVRRTLEVEDLHVSGAAGGLDGDLRLGPGLLEAELDADELDVGWLARTFGAPALASRGKLSGHTELALGQDVTRANARLTLSGFLNSKLALASARFRFDLDNRAFESDLQALDPALGNLGARASGEIDGPALELRSWQRAVGTAEVNLNRFPLWPVGLALPKSIGIDELSGYAQFSAKLQRTDADVAPNLFVQAGTDELKFRYTKLQPALTIEQLVLQATANINGAGHTALAAVARDAHGELISASAALEVDPNQLLADPKAFAQKLPELPVQGFVRLHQRSLAWLPAPFEVPGFAGTVQASLSVSGPLERPSLVLVANGEELMLSGGDVDHAVDISARASYAVESGRVEGAAEVVHAGQRVVNARAQAVLPGAAAGAAGATRNLNVAALVNGLPLALFPPFAERNFEGRVHGSLQLEQNGSDVKEDVLLELLGLSIEGRELGGGRLRLHADRQSARATLRVGSRDKYLRADLRGTADAGAPWWSPAWGEFQGSASARDFEAAAVVPPLPGLLTRVAGEVDADVTVRLKRTPSEWELGIQGDASLERGSVHIDPLGLEVRDISARLLAQDQGTRTQLHAESIQAKARSSRVNMRGDLDLTLQGVRVIEGGATLTLDDVPLTLQGQRRGNATGDARARLTRTPDYMLVDVDLPRLRVRLPSSSSNSLIDLDEPSDIVVLQAEERRRKALPGQLWKIRLKFGSNVRLTRSDLDLPLRGELELDYQDDIRPSGTVEASPGARITLFGRVFVIERGVLRFSPDDPNNPRIDLTANWLAPDGTTISVDVTGTAKQANIDTRDDAGLQDAERLELLAGISSEPGESGDTRGSAAALAIGQTFASLGINELLRESLGDVALRVGTTSENTATYTASVRLSNKLWLEGNFRPGQEQTGLDGSRNAFSGTLDYRLTRNWSLRTELGTSGGALDLLWSYRY